MLRLKILTFLSTVLAILIFVNNKQTQSTKAFSDGLAFPKTWLVDQHHPVCAKEDVRPADQTFLTYPEWFLVYSPAEQADYFHNHTATTFPYMGHVAQIWKSYGIVYSQIKGNYEFNTGYHFMIWVIASSSTVEYSIKSAYETTVGRLTDPNPGEQMTEEDQFNAKYMQAYVDFIRVRPWYEFDFKTQLKNLWSNTSFTGDHFIRKWERKYWLTSELLAKWGYGWLIGLGTKTAYDDALSTTAVAVNKIPAHSQFTIIKVNPDSSGILMLPRYEAFNAAACQLAMEGISFTEIAGNKSAILISVIAPINWNNYGKESKPLFMQNILTDQNLKRVVLVTTVNKLSETIISLKKDNLIIEHVYDY